MYLNIRVICFALTVNLVRSEFDEYINETQHQCSSKNNLFSCAKYRTLRYISGLSQEYGLTGNASSPVKLIKIENYQEATELFPTARQFPTDSEFTKFWKFAKRRINYYLGTQGLLFNLPNGAEVVETPEESSNDIGEGRGKKKKAVQVLLPLIILFKLFKIKIMVALVLASLVFIKKAIMLGALVLPSIIQKLKYCKPQVHYQPHHAEEFHDEEFGGFGGYGGYGGYSKDYDRAYNAYLKSKTR